MKTPHRKHSFIYFKNNFLTEGKVGVGGKGEKDEKPTASVRPTTPGSEPYWNVRLPTDIIPTHYDVTVKIDLDKRRYDGKVAIFVNVTIPTIYVMVHTNTINITESSVQKIGSDGRFHNRI